MITFTLNGKKVTETSASADLTLLRYLRANQQLTGTKEGCGSGDCGACTLAIGEKAANGSLVYRSVNSCLTLLSGIDGKHVITVEGLSSSDDLHPAQTAMVEHHGSQCGFCTPGIVMSLACLANSAEEIEEPSVIDALSGNLCRCTGYRPIIDAGLAMGKSTTVNTWEPQEPIDSSFHPRSIAELKDELLSRPEARLIAGGTDLMLEVTQLYKSIDDFIYLGNIPELNHFEVTDSEIIFGSAVSYSDLEVYLKDLLPEFVSLMHRIGSRQIRNQGTIGGNIANASPIGDTPPALIALDATILIDGPDGERLLLLKDFYKDYKVTDLRQGEFIREIRIPRLKPGQQFKCFKVSKRFEDDISAVMMAAVWSIDVDKFVKNVRVAYGGMAAIPKRANSVENLLEGKKLSEEVILSAVAALAKDFSPMTDVRASSSYRLNVAGGLLKKAFWLEDEAVANVFEDLLRLSAQYWPEDRAQKELLS